MNNKFCLQRGWIAALSLIALLAACGKQELPPTTYSLPEVNEANCKFEAIKAMPAELQQAFSQQCVRRSKPVESEQKSYKF